MEFVRLVISLCPLVNSNSDAIFCRTQRFPFVVKAAFICLRLSSTVRRFWGMALVEVVVVDMEEVMITTSEFHLKLERAA